jgi:nucleotide-binding universal stress UspA family protein
VIINQPQVSDQPEAVCYSPGTGRIVVGVDGSPGSLGALRWALSEALLRRVDVLGVGAWEYPGGMGSRVSADDTSPKDALAAAIRATVATTTAPTSSGGASSAVTVTISLVQGEPARELQRAAGRSDLLVVGSRGHREVSGLLLGSVSEHVVSHARCPVVVVPNLVHAEEDAPA